MKEDFCIWQSDQNYRPTPQRPLSLRRLPGRGQNPHPVQPLGHHPARPHRPQTLRPPRGRRPGGAARPSPRPPAPRRRPTTGPAPRHRSPLPPPPSHGSTQPHPRQRPPPQPGQVLQRQRPAPHRHPPPPSRPGHPQPHHRSPLTVETTGYILSFKLSFGRQDKIAQQLDAFPMRVRSQANSQWGELSANNLGNLVEYNIIYLYGIGLKL